jgi:signal transduction histidine kinase
MNRRKRQSGLFVVAVVLPAALLSLLTIRFVRQEKQLDEQQATADRATAAEQARRALLTRLENIQLQEENRRILKTKPGDVNPPADATLVVVTPWNENRLELPWAAPVTPYPTPQFVTFRDSGEEHEFRLKNLDRAAENYRRAMAMTQQPEELCDGRLALGRVLAKAQKTEQALEHYREILKVCDGVLDETGMPFSLYAANRLIELKLDVPAAMNYLEREVRGTPLRPLLQAHMIRSILEMAEADEARRLGQTVTLQISDTERLLKLSDEFPALRPKAQAAWIAYGDQAWIVTAKPASAQLPPLVYVISSAKVAPQGTKLVPGLTTTSYSLAPEFSGMSLELDPAQSFSANGLPSYVYAIAIALMLGLTILSGYLLLAGVNRDLRMAEMRSHFVASVSHELKTPLTAIRMFAETIVLGRAKDEATRNEYIETIVNESERLTRLVDNVLDFSKIEQGKKIYRLRPTPLPEVVRSAARAMQYPLAQQGFHLDVTIDDTIPNLPVDADAIEQAILNLLSNAMKYSGDARTIDLLCARQNGNAVISVADRGIGIDLQEQPHIFEKFYRVRSSETELIAGTGLGLTLVKHIAQAHGGSVDVQSVPGSGSTFYVRIPCPPEVHA